MNLTGKKVLMIVAPNNFRDEELFEPKKILEHSGAKVFVASKDVVAAQGMLGSSIKIDIDIKKVVVKDYDAIIFIGGSGSMVYFQDNDAISIAKQAVDKQKVLGAICLAPTILARAGLLQNKTATCFESQATALQQHGARYVREKVVVDGKIVTAPGPEAARLFGEKIAGLLSQ
jgi:protease I